MRSNELTWSKTRAQDPYCGGWYTRQGIQGHIRFRHPDAKKTEQTNIEKASFALMYAAAVGMLAKNGRLTQDLREQLLDRMLLDFLERKARGKT